MDARDSGDGRHAPGQISRQNEAAPLVAGKARAHVVADSVGDNRPRRLLWLAGGHDDVGNVWEGETWGGLCIKGPAVGGGRDSSSSLCPKAIFSPSHQAAAVPARPPFVARMAPFFHMFLACSLLAFVSVRASTQRTHPRDTAVIRASAPVVAVKNGSYEGVYSPEYDQDFFLGMRYAQVRAVLSLLALSRPSPYALPPHIPPPLHPLTLCVRSRPSASVSPNRYHPHGTAPRPPRPTRPPA